MHKLMLGAAMVLALTTANSRAANIVETASGAGVFKTLLAAASAAGLADALASGENLTVFAPTDDAFEKLPAGTVEGLLKPENKAQLAAILSYHVLPRKLTASQIPTGPIHVRTLKSGGDRTLSLKKGKGGVMVDNAKVIKADIMADNGVIHVIDTVMLPKN